MYRIDELIRAPPRWRETVISAFKSDSGVRKTRLGCGRAQHLGIKVKMANVSLDLFLASFPPRLLAPAIFSTGPLVSLVVRSEVAGEGIFSRSVERLLSW